MEAAVNQLKTDLVTVESLLRADIHKVDERVDILTKKVDTGFEMMSRLFAAAEENMRVMNANMVAMKNDMAAMGNDMAAMEQRLRSEAQASEARLLAAIQGR